jgi:diguanylate cyclase (GGDEF)-like protein
VTIDAAAQHLPPGQPEGAQARVRRRRGERLRMLGLVFISYLVDSGMLALLGLAGAVDLLAAGYYALGGATACLGFYLALRGGWSERFRDPYLTSAQIVTASALQLGVAWLAPPVGALLLCIIFLVFSFSALRLTLRQLVPVWGAVSLGVVAVVLLSEAPLALPAATPWQAVLSGLWVSVTVGRCAFVGLYGASVRELLGSRNRELAAAQGRLQDLASRDELTGALNRRAIMAIVSEHLQRRRQGGPSFAVALLDLDHFKQVNDRHGHLVGDEVLRRFVVAAARSLRGGDRMGRYGGEEFLLLIDGATDVESARAVAERLRQATESQPWAEVAAGLQVTLSAGLAFADGTSGLEQLLQQADEALYAAKSGGRNRVCTAVSGALSVSVPA